MYKTIVLDGVKTKPKSFDLNSRIMAAQLYFVLYIMLYE